MENKLINQLQSCSIYILSQNQSILYNARVQVCYYHWSLVNTQMYINVEFNIYKTYLTGRFH